MNAQLDFLTQDELAAILKVRPGYVTALARDGRVPCLKIGSRTYRFDLVEVLEKLREAATETNADTNADAKK